MDEQRVAVRAMQDYISEHIRDEITIEDLAMAAGFSPWHARRLFVKYLNMTPAVYVRRLKLSKSALRLRDEAVTVLDVALMDISVHFEENLDVIRRSIRAVRFQFGFLLLT